MCTSYPIARLRFGARPLNGSIPQLTLAKETSSYVLVCGAVGAAGPWAQPYLINLHPVMRLSRPGRDLGNFTKHRNVHNDDDDDDDDDDARSLRADTLYLDSPLLRCAAQPVDAGSCLRPTLHEPVLPSNNATGPGMRSLLILLPLLGATQTVSAEIERICANACRKCFQSVTFAPAAPKFEQSCRNRLALSSSYLCFHLNCGADDRDAALASLNASCQEILRVSIPPFSLVADYTADDIARLRRVTKDDSFGADDALDEIVLPSPDFFRVWNDTLVR